MHFQIPPAPETKLVRYTRGALYDVIIDLRSESPTYRQHFGVELSQDNHLALYVPALFAHGYITLADNTEADYQISAFYEPSASRGMRYNDPLYGITWPIPVAVISDRDAQWPLLQVESNELT